MFDTDDAALAKDAVPGISDIHMAKVFRMVYEHASSDQPTDMETVAMYTPGGMSAHEICVLDTIM